MSNLSYYLMAFFWLPCWSGSSSLERHSVHGGFRASLAKAIPQPIGLCWLCRASSSSPFSRPERLGTFGRPAALPLSFAYETSNQALERAVTGGGTAGLATGPVLGLGCLVGGRAAPLEGSRSRPFRQMSNIRCPSKASRMLCRRAFSGRTESVQSSSPSLVY